jgi:hypothetical protein
MNSSRPPMVTVVFCPCLVQFFRPFVVIFRRIGDLFFFQGKKNRSDLFCGVSCCHFQNRSRSIFQTSTDQPKPIGCFRQGKGAK